MLNSTLEFSDEDKRIIANTGQFYDNLMSFKRELARLPFYKMDWKTVKNTEYLYGWPEQGNEKSQGRRSPQTEKILKDFNENYSRLQDMIDGIGDRLARSLAQYRSLHLPQIMELPARVLRILDNEGHLGENLIVVGTNAFAAYEIEAGERFAHGLDETEDFDMGWCRGSSISFQRTTRDSRVVGSPLFAAIKLVDGSFQMNPEKPYQAVNRAGYEVELLAAPSVHRSMCENEVFSPAPIPEQEWLLLGKPLRHVVCARDGTAAPMIVPDPRWMALHKMWLSKKPERRADKKAKDFKQGDLLLSAVVRKMTLTHPVDTDFVMSIPDELMDIFNDWTKRHSYIPEKPEDAAGEKWWNQANG